MRRPFGNLVRGVLEQLTLLLVASRDAGDLAFRAPADENIIRIEFRNAVHNLVPIFGHDAAIAADPASILRRFTPLVRHGFELATEPVRFRGVPPFSLTFQSASIG